MRGQRGEIRKEAKLLLRRSEFDLQLGRTVAGVGKEMRLATRHDRASASFDNLFPARDNNFDAARSHRKMLVRAGMDMKQRVAATRTTLLQDDFEPGDRGIVDRS